MQTDTMEWSGNPIPQQNTMAANETLVFVSGLARRKAGFIKITYVAPNKAFVAIYPIVGGELAGIIGASVIQSSFGGVNVALTLPDMYHVSVVITNGASGGYCQLSYIYL